MAHPPQLVLGIDTHKGVHAAVLLDRLGRYLAGANHDAASNEIEVHPHANSGELMESDREQRFAVAEGRGDGSDRGHILPKLGLGLGAMALG